MIVVDTSALMAILLGEPEAGACMGALSTADALLISAGTAAEALIVADRRSVGPEMRRLVDELGCAVAPVTRPWRGMWPMPTAAWVRVSISRA